jgi:hypothetical protein
MGKGCGVEGGREKRMYCKNEEKIKKSNSEPHRR